MSNLALQLIAENQKTRATFLDLGQCGLTSVPAEVSQLVWLESLSLSDDWQEWDGKDRNHRQSKNAGESNQGLIDIGAVTGLVNLRSLYLSDSQVGDLLPLKALTKLKALQIQGDQLDDVTPLAGLKDLESLVVSGQDVHDLAPLASLVNL